MMKAIEEARMKPQLIRGIVVRGFDKCGLISTDLAEMERRGENYARATTKWFRHDGDLKQLEFLMSTLSSTFMGYGAEGCLLSIETRPYKKI